MDKDTLRNNIVSALKTVYDIEIPVDIYALGLIYEINIDDDSNVRIVMTLTSPNCPEAENLPIEVNTAVKLVEGVKEVVVDIVFEPTWTMDMMDPDAMLDLGLL